MHSPLRAVKQLDKKTVEVSVPSLLDELNVPKDSVLIIDLNDAKADEDRSEMLKRHGTEQYSSLCLFGTA